MDFITFQFQIGYETSPGEEIYIYGDCPDFGNWKQPKFKLRWSKGHIWKADYQISKSSNCIKFKFVCHSNTYDKWEEGENRLLSPKNLNGLSKTSDGKYILDCVWNHFKINLNIHYVPSNPSSYMQVVGAPDALSNWQKTNEKPVKMELQNSKEITAKDGNKITGFWTVTALMRNSDKRNLDFEYRYSLYEPSNGTAIWEREPNRHLHFFLDEDEIATFYDPKISPDSCYLLTNSYLEILDVNFVANLVFNKMGDKKIYIGPYPQSEDDFKTISESGIDSILNVQSDKDLIFRQINHQLQLKQAKKYGITINRYPIEDFNQEDLFEKLKGAGDLLNKLMKQGKTVYVHCTAGMSRAAATVIIYLVLYEDFNVEEATKFCKKHRPVICPNYGVINRIASIYKPGSEMSGASMFNFTPSSFKSELQKQIDLEREKEIEREKERRRLREERRKERILKEQKLREKEKQRLKEKEEEEEEEEKPKKKIIKKKIKVKKKVKANNDENGDEKKIEENNKIIKDEKDKNNEEIPIKKIKKKIIKGKRDENNEENKNVKNKQIKKVKKEIIKDDDKKEIEDNKIDKKENIEKKPKTKIIKKVIVKKKKSPKTNIVKKEINNENENKDNKKEDIKEIKEEIMNKNETINDEKINDNNEIQNQKNEELNENNHKKDEEKEENNDEKNIEKNEEKKEIKMEDEVDKNKEKGENENEEKEENEKEEKEENEGEENENEEMEGKEENEEDE